MATTVPMVVSSASPPHGGGPFSKVPLEIFLRITSHLCMRDLCAMRLTCTTAEQSLFHAFTAEFFNKRQFMVSTESLQALVGIASCPRLSDCITHIVIGLDRYSDYEKSHKAIIHSEAANVVVRLNSLSKRSLDHRTLLSSGAARDMLEDAFSKLPRLTTIEIRDYNAKGRRRNNDDDGEDKKILWSSYGSTTARRECREQPSFADERFELFVVHWAEEVFQITLAAAARANLRLDCIDINTSKANNAIGSDGFHAVAYLAPKVDALLANLSRCLLHAKFNDRPVSVMTESGPRSTTIWAFCNFLHKLKNVRHLRLNLTDIHFEQVTDFMSWLAETSVREYPPPDKFPAGTIRQMPPALNVPLEKLEFGRFRTSPKALLSVINKFRDSLTGLSFQRLSLDPDAGTSAQPNYNNNINRWSKLFERLRNMPLKVTDWRLMSLRQQHPRYGNITIRFGLTGDAYGRDALRTYQGPEWKSFLASLDPLMERYWPKMPESDHEDSDEDEDDDDSVENLSVDSSIGDDD